MEETFEQDKYGSDDQIDGGIHISESVIIREKARKITHTDSKKKGVETMKKGKEEVGKGSIPLLLKLEDGNNAFHSKMGKEYSTMKKRREEDKKVRKCNMGFPYQHVKRIRFYQCQRKSVLSYDDHLMTWQVKTLSRTCCF